MLAEDTADLVGIVLAAAGIAIGQATGSPVWDGLASIAIGVLLAVVSLSLVRRGRSLLTGRSAAPETVASIHQIVGADPDVVRSDPPRTMQLGPGAVLVAVQVEFRGDATGGDVARASVRIEAAVCTAHPEVTEVFTEPTLPTGG